jgi:YD repeat-containing protein
MRPETAAGRRKERYVHNRVGLLMQKSVNGLVETVVQHDTSNRLERIINARGYAMRQVRNEYGQTIETEYPDGSKVKRKYEVRHRQVVERTDELRVKTRYQYDEKGNLTRKTKAVGRVFQTRHNVAGLRVEEDVDGRKTQG